MRMRPLSTGEILTTKFRKYSKTALFSVSVCGQKEFAPNSNAIYLPTNYHHFTPLDLLLSSLCWLASLSQQCSSRTLSLSLKCSERSRPERDVAHSATTEITPAGRTKSKDNVTILTELVIHDRDKLGEGYCLPTSMGKSPRGEARCLRGLTTFLTS